MKSNKPSTHLNAALIMQRLPFHRQLSLSQSLLIKCLPIWQQWAKQNLTSETANSIHLSHFHEKELIMHCENAISATQIKQQLPTLLLYLQNEGMKDIKKITVRIANNANNLNITAASGASEIAKSNTEAVNRVLATLDENALNCIKSAQKTTGNQALSESLSRLINTIEKNQ